MRQTTPPVLRVTGERCALRIPKYMLICQLKMHDSGTMMAKFMRD